MAASSTSPRSSATDVNFNVHAHLQPAQFVEPGGASAAVRRPRRRQRQSARHDRRSTPPTRSTRSARCAATIRRTPANEATYAFIGRRVVENGPRRYDQQVDTYYRRRHARRLVPAARPRLVLGRQRRLGPQQGRAGGARQHQRRQSRPRARPGRGLHRALRAVQHLRRRGLDHPGDARLCRLHPARQQPAADLGLLRQPDRRPVRAARRPGRHRDRRRASRPVAAASIPIRSSPPASAPTFRRCRPRAATMSTRPMPSCGCRCSATRPSSTASS